MELTLKPAAERFIRRMMRMAGMPHGGCRLVVTAGGCSGLSAEFSIEASPRPGDSVVEVNGVTLFLPAESRLLLDRVTIDFVDSAMQTGFVFHDPKQTDCGCSTPDLVRIADVESVR